MAIPLPVGIKDKVEKAREQLRRAAPGDSIRWTRREQFHLTLKFLGNVAVSRVDELVGGLRSSCAGFGTLNLRAEGIGFFPDAGRPRVVWAGVRDDGDRLAQLQRKIVSATRDFTEEKPEGEFAGHVTLGRIKSLRRSDAEMLSKAAEAMATELFGEWIVDEVELIRSELSSSGSRYATVAIAPLGSRS